MLIKMHFHFNAIYSPISLYSCYGRSHQKELGYPDPESVILKITLIQMVFYNKTFANIILLKG